MTSSKSPSYLSNIRLIYDAISDETSKTIFKHRLLYSLLRDKNEILEMLCKINPNYPKLQELNHKFCIYGAGRGCTYLFNETFGTAPFIIDNYKEGELDGVPIITFDEFLQLPDCKNYLILISVGKTKLKEEIEAELIKHGLKYVFAYFDLPYFDLPYFDLHNEYFVDAGVLSGESTRDFFEVCPNGYAYLFEPSPEQFKIAKENLIEFKSAEFYQFGLWNENTTLHFNTSDDDRGGAKISESGNVVIEARKLDDILDGKRVTFIKMDIEGAELNALKGAEKIITSQKPKLAVSVYHKPEDIWEIPYAILNLCPEYKLYLRHYSIFTTETILYAIV